MFSFQQLQNRSPRLYIDMDNQFYVHLFSNENRSYFPSNEASCFTCLLPETLHLQGRWYVGLAEIEYTLGIKAKERPLHIQVCSDICTDTITGSTKVGILRYIPIQNKRGHRVFETLAPVQYVLVNKQEINRIEISLKAPTVDYKDLFSREPVRCTLHFTKAPLFPL